MRAITFSALAASKLNFTAIDDDLTSRITSALFAFPDILVRLDYVKHIHLPGISTCTLPGTPPVELSFEGQGWRTLGD
jgi:hypothetical protein